MLTVKEIDAFADTPKGNGTAQLEAAILEYFLDFKWVDKDETTQRLLGTYDGIYGYWATRDMDKGKPYDERVWINGKFREQWPLFSYNVDMALKIFAILKAKNPGIYLSIVTLPNQAWQAQISAREYESCLSQNKNLAFALCQVCLKYLIKNYPGH